MKLLALVTAALLPIAASLAAATAASPSRPNVILIYSDDHGYADLGAQGVDKDIRTPHLDALARDGVRFVRGYVTAPQCVPSRAGVINFDAWITYWRLQLNDRNVLDRNTVFPLVTVDTRDGQHTPSVAIYNLKEPRTYQFTSTFKV